MKTTIKYIFITLIYSSLMLSCSKDEEDVNLPPEDVTNIQATVISGTMVRISWNAALDKNKDPIKYEVVVNEKILAKNILETSLELDIEEFIPNRSGNGKSSKNGTKDFAAKMGLEVVLGIEIKAFDGSGGFSSESVIKNLSINRAPEDFSFANIYFDVEGFNYLEVSWSPAIDKDGDKITYSVYLNSIELAKDVSIIAGNPFGYAYYYNNYANLAEEEITVKVVAKDTSGETKEISESYIFRATDIDLGNLDLPYTETVEFFVPGDEPDNRIRILFTISAEQGYNFSANGDYVSLTLKTSNGQYLNSGYPSINGGGLIPGTYYLELFSNAYNDTGTFGSLNMLLKSATESDIDLGLLTVPTQGVLDFDLTNEIDQRLSFLFEISESSGYSFTTFGNVDFMLSSNGNYVNGNFNGVRGAELAPGTYKLEISSYYGGQQGQISYEFKDSRLSDQNLGTLESASLHEFPLAFNNEPDDKIIYTFELSENSGYSFYTNSDVLFTLFDSNGYYINGGGYKRLIGKELLVGSYVLEISSQTRTVDSNFFMTFSDATEGDVDLGNLELPYSQSFNFFFNINSPDDTVAYTLKINELSNYNISFSSGIYVEFKDQNGNYLNSGYSNFVGVDLQPGNYIIEVKNSDYYYNTPSINGAISIKFSTD